MALPCQDSCSQLISVSDNVESDFVCLLVPEVRFTRQRVDVCLLVPEVRFTRQRVDESSKNISLVRMAADDVALVGGVNGSDVLLR